MTTAIKTTGVGLKDISIASAIDAIHATHTNGIRIKATYEGKDSIECSEWTLNLLAPKVVLKPIFDDRNLKVTNVESYRSGLLSVVTVKITVLS